MSTSQSTTATLREIPLSRIVVPAGLNPRGHVDDSDPDLAPLISTIQQRGVLQPILVPRREPATSR